MRDPARRLAPAPWCPHGGFAGYAMPVQYDLSGDLATRCLFAARR
jgi:hypothetical protein